ncbi:ATP-binding protein [Paracoccus sp. p4-l81]|uniref:sensor histidine kinase n=1 Tax=unclassified Paracoccus (in: a-proteobacteria) TaxID=2688777 RepID=UPI0035B9EB94
MTLWSRAWSGAGLQRKLVFVVIGVLALASVLFLGVLASHYRSQMIDAHARAATQINDLLQGALENAMLKRDIPGLQDILTGLGTQQGVARAMIIAPSREVRFASDPGLIGQVLGGEAVLAAVASQDTATRYLDEGGATVLRSVNPVHNRAECAACHPPVSAQPVNGLLVVDFEAATIRAEAIRSTLTLAGIGALVTAMGSAALWLALRRVVIAPLARLSAASQALAGGALDTRVALPGQDEIAALGQSFNRMAQGLAGSMAAVERSKAGLQSLIDGIPDGVRVIGADYIIRTANDAYARQVGQPLSAIVGQPCHLSSHGRATPCPATLVTCPVAELRAGQRAALTFRDTHVAGPDAQTAVEVSSAPIPGDDGDAVVESIRDLDRQMRLSQAERLSEIGLLAAGVAHEIHNPLSSVELAMQALSREVAAGRPERAADYFDLMRDEIGKCLQITDNLLRLSAPPGEGQALIDLLPVVQGATGILRFQAERLGVSVVTDVPADLRLLMPDADLRMLLTNLVMNSFHAMQPGGVTTIAARRLPQAGRIQLTVADTGVGIAPADLERIFMPFWSRRADNSTGRGLGLAIVRSILDRSGGQVKVDSQQGEGTTFTLTFPDPDAEPPASPAAKGV